jgi:2-dehydropantoate 2-reductase
MGRIMPASPKFCIFGAGVIGGIVATLLARSGAMVSVVVRGQTLATLNRDGVRLIIKSEMLQVSVQASKNPSELGVQDYVIIAVKAPSLPDIAMPRYGTVEEIAGMVAYLASPEAGYITGASLMID